MIRVTYSNPMHVSLQPSEFPACTFTIFLIKHVLVNFTFEKYYDVRTPDVSVFFYFIFLLLLLLFFRKSRSILLGATIWLHMINHAIHSAVIINNNI